MHSLVKIKRQIKTINVKYLWPVEGLTGNDGQSGSSSKEQLSGSLIHTSGSIKTQSPNHIPHRNPASEHPKSNY